MVVVTAIQKVSNLPALVGYLETVKEGKQERNLMVAGQGVPPSQFVDAVRATRRAHGTSRDVVMARSMVFSFTEAEVDPADEEACKKAFDMVADAFCQQYPGRLGLLAGQRDGDSGLFHVHGVVANIHPQTGRAMRGQETSWRSLVTELHDRQQMYGIEHSDPRLRRRAERIVKGQDAVDPGAPRHQKYARRRGESVWTSDLAVKVVTAVDWAIEHDQPRTVEELDRALAPQGLGVRNRPKKDGTPQWTYFERDSDGREMEGRSMRHRKVQKTLEQTEDAPTGPVDPEAVLYLAQSRARTTQRQAQERERQRQLAEAMPAPARKQAPRRRARPVAQRRSPSSTDDRQVDEGPEY